MSRCVELAEYSSHNDGPAVWGLGFFDGVHLGHQALLNEVIDLAQKKGCEPWVFTFANHPDEVLRPQFGLGLLQSFEQRVQRLQSYGVNVCFTHFDRDFSLLDANDFITDILMQKLRAQGLVCGPNYRFGHRAFGGVSMLAQKSQEMGVECRVADSVLHEESLVSSTRIRQALGEGEVKAAQEMLGHPFVVEGDVVSGAGRGKELEAPTANLLWPKKRVKIPRGVYAVYLRCELEGLENRFEAVANFGVAPTFGDRQELLEVHLLDRSLNLYGKRVEVELVDFLRSERQFSDSEELRGQIHKDIEEARNTLKK